MMNPQPAKSSQRQRGWIFLASLAVIMALSLGVGGALGVNFGLAMQGLAFGIAIGTGVCVAIGVALFATKKSEKD